jgi:MATE family multidrug resistance protein
LLDRVDASRQSSAVTMSRAREHRAAAAPGIAGVRREISPLWRLAWPVVLSELGWMGMALVDTMMVGRVSPEALGGVSIGSGIFFAIAIFGMGVLFGLDFMVAQAFGAGRRGEMHAWLAQGIYLSAILTVLLTIVLRSVLPWLPWFGVRPEVAVEAMAYGETVSWSFLPLFVFTALRRYLQARNLVKPVMFALVSANVMNAVGDWAFIFGHLGFPPMAVRGAAWATVVSRVYLCLFLIFAVRRSEAGLDGSPSAVLRFDVERARKLVRLGLPAALQVTLEVGVFVTATTIVGTLDAISLAAHHVALSVASVTFMVPLGISSAAAVRVGQAVGRRSPADAKAAGWAAIALGAAAMAVAGVAFVLLPEWIARVFTNDAATVASAASLLGIAAVFQLFDGIQVSATGALRGLGDTRTPMLTNLVGHWFLGLPLGCYLAFQAGTGVTGVWVGLCVGLIVVALVLLRAWRGSVPAAGD